MKVTILLLATTKNVKIFCGPKKPFVYLQVGSRIVIHPHGIIHTNPLPLPVVQQLCDLVFGVKSLLLKKKTDLF
jgi:hypothetical protein